MGKISSYLDFSTLTSKNLKKRRKNKETNGWETSGILNQKNRKNNLAKTTLTSLIYDWTYN